LKRVEPSELQFVTLVCCRETQTFIETACIGASLVRGELDYWATTAARLVNDQLEHNGSETQASMARGDPYGFGLRSKRPTSRQAWDERELHSLRHAGAATLTRARGETPPELPG